MHPGVSLGSVAPPPPASSHLPSIPVFPSAQPVPPSTFVSSGAPGVPPSSPDVSAGLGTSALRGVPPSASRGSVFDFAGASDSHNDTFLYRGFNDSSVKGEKELSAVGKADFFRAFHVVVSLITIFFPHAKPSSSSVESYPWMEVLGASNCRNPPIFLKIKPWTTRRRLPQLSLIGVTCIIWETLAIFIRPPGSTRVFLCFWINPFHLLITSPCLWMTPPNFRLVFRAKLSPSPFPFGLSQRYSSF